TNGQKGPRRMTADFFLGEGGSEKYIEPYGLFLQQIRREFRGGASNVILVRGKDITQAVKAAALAFVRGRSANGPVNPEGETKPPEIWLVAYFGTAASDRPAWLVDSVERKGKIIRVAYRLCSAEGKDIHLYFLWVPLGELERATYTLELFDADRKEVTLL